MTDKKPTAVNITAESPVIETARLRLRMFRPDDLDALASLFADAEVMRYVGDGIPVGREAAETAIASIINHWQRNGFGRWAVEDKDTREFVGYGGLRSLLGTPEVVYHLARAHWGKGFATEMGRASLEYGFAVRGFPRIVAIAKPANAASIHIMQKLGMRFERQASYYGIQVVQYAINNSRVQID